MGYCSPHAYGPAPFAYYWPVPAGVMLMGNLVAQGRGQYLNPIFVKENEAYLEQCLALNPDYRGNGLPNVAYYIYKAEGQVNG